MLDQLKYKENDIIGGGVYYNPIPFIQIFLIHPDE